MTALTGRPAPTDRCRAFIRVGATYRGMGVPEHVLAEVFESLMGDPQVTPIELELALHQYVPEPVWESNTPCKRFALAGHNQTSGEPGQALRS